MFGNGNILLLRVIGVISTGILRTTMLAKEWVVLLLLVIDDPYYLRLYLIFVSVYMLTLQLYMV